ncbi:MAG TPA: TROVE domain-containing protein [Polyangiaceae bacterium]|nr:TROVE domain-containing protein [Polyangiaceae bacterium]
MRYSRHFKALATPQSAPARVDQKQNDAGGFAFEADRWQRLDRFLVLGSDGGSFYVSEKALTVDNAGAVLDCLAADGLRTVARIVEISVRGLAPKNDAALFALAMASGADDVATRRAALAALPKVARTATHLFHFVADVDGFRRWGRSLRRAVAAWYTDKPAGDLALQLVKYRQRDGWTHEDVMRLAHPVPSTPEHAALFRYALGKSAGERRVKRGDVERVYPAVGEPSPFVAAFEEAQRTDEVRRVVELVRAHGLTHEMLPTRWKRHRSVWEALLERMPMTAMVRSLAKMTEVGLLEPRSEASKKVAARLGDVSAIRKARLHPLSILVAQHIYARGKGDKGKLAWAPDRAIVDALDAAFYLAFDAIVPTGKKILLALDVSGSMDGPAIAGMPGITPRVGSAAMAMVTARTERDWAVVGFSSGVPGEYTSGDGRSMHRGFRAGLSPIAISPRQRLDDVIKTVQAIPMGGTDCALPMLYAAAREMEVDAFVVYTDSETWAGDIHPFEALRRYRRRMGKPEAKLIVVGMVANGFTIADPKDPNMLDVVGFSSDVPAVMSDFIRGQADGRAASVA